jgi:hypothetical protein
MLHDLVVRRTSRWSSEEFLGALVLSSHDNILGVFSGYARVGQMEGGTPRVRVDYDYYTGRLCQLR